MLSRSKLLLIQVGVITRRAVGRKKLLVRPVEEVPLLDANWTHMLSTFIGGGIPRTLET